MDEAAFFAEHGWIALRSVFPAGLAFELASELDRVFPGSRLDADRPHERIGVAALSPLLTAQVRDAQLAQRIAALLRAPRVQLLQDTALVKPPHSRARVEWHQDHTYTGYIAECVSVRMALTDCTLLSGCLRVLDGSHRAGFRGALRPLTSREVTDDSHHMPDGEVVPVELRAGDVSVHHCLTFHCSEENRSDKPRMTLIARMFDARQKLVCAKVPKGYEAWFPTDPEGHLTGETFPLLGH